MKKTKDIIMITASGCDKCKEVERRILNAAQKANIKPNIQFLDSSTMEAVRIGIQYGLTDVPSFVINGNAFCGVEFSNKKLEKEMRLVS